MTNYQLEYKPLVSVIVITYNSAKYVFETLESIQQQTYSNIELIVCDDGSKDNTVDLCQKWMDKKKDRFVRTQLIASDINKGIPANCNRGLKAARGNWVKFIAGDDALKENCIKSNVSYVGANPCVNIIKSNMEFYRSCFNPSSLTEVSDLKNKPFFKPAISSKEQYKMILKNRGIIMTPTLFFKKSCLLKVDGFDERLRLFEDLPMLIKLTQKGYRIDFLNEVTVKYRISNYSVQKGQNPYKSIDFAQELLLFNKLYVKNQISSLRYHIRNLGIRLIIVLNMLGLNRQCKISHLLFRVANIIRKI